MGRLSYGFSVRQALTVYGIRYKEYFENVPPEAWEFRVGGHRATYTRVDDRVDCFLTDDELVHSMRMFAAMRDTAALLPEVDAAFKAILPQEESIADELS